MRSLLLTLAVLTPAVVQAQTPQRFRFVSQSTTTSEMPSLKKKMASLSAMAGGDDVIAALPDQEFGESITATFTLTRHDSAGGTSWHAVVDSFFHDAGKMGEMLKSMGMGAAASTSPIGASVDFYIKKGELVGSVKPSLPVGSDLQMLGDALQAAFSIPPEIAVGQPNADSSFVDEPTPGQGNAVRTKTKTVTRRLRPAADSVVLVTETLTNTDLGSTRGSMLGATTDSKHWSLTSDAGLKNHLSKNEASIVMVVPFSGLQVTQTTVTKTLTRIP